jgi:two-component sensor histidine kinase
MRGAEGDEKWIESEWGVEFDADGRPLRAFVANLDITERRRAEEQRKVLMAEVNHRSKNLLAVVQAIVQKTVRSSSPDDFAVKLARRLHGLAANQDLLIGSEWRGVEIMDLMRAQLSPFGDLIYSRIFLDGPSARLKAAAAQAIGMAVHELATNATKYGSLSVEDGSVFISWEAPHKSAGAFSIRWTEDGGPKVSEPNRKGFGHMVIGRAVEAAVDGVVKIAFEETGLTWALEAPASAILEAD